MDPSAVRYEIADLPLDGSVESVEVLGRGFRNFERVRFTAKGEKCPRRAQDILRAGPAVAVLPLDMEREELILLRQFRLPAQLATGKGDLVEIVAGHVEPTEKPAETARRECLEEIGLTPRSLVELFTYLPSPGMSDEEITLFLGIVDAGPLAQSAGLAAEHEQTSPMRVPIDAALAASSAGSIRNGPLIVALQWLALNRQRLPEIVRRAAS